jgi:DNA methylase N-4/N-6 domain protein
LENKNQIQEWKDLGFIENENILDEKYLKNNQTLSIDTKFFDKKVKGEILGSFENLDKETNGILINSENFQALNLLKNKYR